MLALPLNSFAASAYVMSAPPFDLTRAAYAPHDSRRTAALPGRLEEPLARQQRLQRTGERDPWAAAQQQPTSLGGPSANLTSADRMTTTYGAFPSASAARWSGDSSRLPRNSTEGREIHASWPPSPSFGHYPTDSMGAEYNSRTGYPMWHDSSQHRTSPDQYGQGPLGGAYLGGEAGYGAGGLQTLSANHPQRRPSNRDEFDGPSQLLDKPEAEAAYEPKEEELPQLPVTLYAQEQDEILSKVNDRLSQCAFDFIAKYQFPIPIEPDKRPVRVPNDREWSEWVYLLKRLATKRRIPARVLYNGQIKQLITILENSLEMRHAAKHQSRPLKDDRNILQLISSGLQVAKIVKDAPAMQFLDSLYVQTERLIQARKVPLPASGFPVTSA